MAWSAGSAERRTISLLPEGNGWDGTRRDADIGLDGTGLDGMGVIERAGTKQNETKRSGMGWDEPTDLDAIGTEKDYLDG